MVTKKDIKQFQENPPHNPNSQYALSYLFRRLDKFIKIIKGREQDKRRAYGEIYRHLVRLVVKVQEEFEKVEQYLLDNMNEDDIIFFVDQKSKEKIYKKDGEIILAGTTDKQKEWKKAYQQIVEDDDG